MQLSMSDLMRVQPPVEPPFGMADATPTPPAPAPFFPSQTVRNAYGVLAIASSGIGFYHGYLRNGGSLGWGLGWAIMGSLAPVLTPALAFAQGIGERSTRANKHTCLESDCDEDTGSSRALYCSTHSAEHSKPERRAPRTVGAWHRGSDTSEGSPGSEGALKVGEGS